jgi:hypothetical protein
MYLTADPWYPQYTYSILLCSSKPTCHVSSIITSTLPTRCAYPHTDIYRLMLLSCRAIDKLSSLPLLHPPAKDYNGPDRQAMQVGAVMATHSRQLCQSFLQNLRTYSAKQSPRAWQ